MAPDGDIEAAIRVELDRCDASRDEFFQQTLALLAAKPSIALAVGLGAEQRARASGDRLALVRAKLLQGMAHSALGNTLRDATLAEALQLAESEAEPTTLVRAVNSQIVVDIFHGRYADALWRGQSILGMAHALRRNDLLWRLTINLGTALGLIGEFPLAISMFGECLGLLEKQGELARQQKQQTINNMAWSWLGIARVALQEANAEDAARALSRARAFAEEACEGALRESNGPLRASALDTLVGVLLELGDVDQARRWVARVTEDSAHLLVHGSSGWMTLALAQCQAEMADQNVDLSISEARLREIEDVANSADRGGALYATLNRCLFDNLSRQGRFREALAYHRRWLQSETRTQSLLAREHALAVHRTLESLRGETEEFITHDVRNPLGAALVQLEAALGGAMTSPNRTRVASARKHVQQALDTADRYLSILRTRHLRRADLKPIDLAELVDDVGERLAPPLSAAVRLERVLDWGLAVRGDRILLLAALNELLRDALDSAPAGSNVEWKLGRVDGHARLAIGVQGSAWAESIAARLRRLGGAGQRGGRDMAAAMLARVAQLHDSRIEAAVDLNGAIRIEWRLPLVGESGWQ